MPTGGVDVLVLGAGYVGLTTALTLAESGRRVDIWSARSPLETTSAAAGAMWAPYPLEPLDQVATWRAQTLDVLRRLATRAGTGVRLACGVEATRVPADTTISKRPQGARPCRPDELPTGYADGFRFHTALVDMPVQLTYLERRLVKAGVRRKNRRATSLAEAARHAPVVVNCTGVGARDLVPDSQVTPVRGQIVVVENPGLTGFFCEDSGAAREQCFIYPHGATAVLGGIAEPGSWSLEPDRDVAAGILDRCVAVEPRLRGARVIGYRVGLRPGRPQVRVEEAGRIGATRLIHNYGHGRAGISLSWGCAASVAALLRPE